MRKLALQTISTLLFLSSPLLATIIRVPQDQPTIQAGINAAVSGDTVLVASGTYFENVNFNGKNIILKSISGPGATMIRGGGPIIKLVSGEDTTATIDGFRIFGGFAPNGGGILFNNSGGTVVNNIFDSCSASGGSTGNGGAIACIGALSRVRIFNNVIKNGLGGGEHGQADAIFCMGSTVDIFRNLITGNTSVAVIFAYTGSRVKLINNTIANTAFDGYALNCSDGAVVDVRNNIFYKNPGGGINNFAGSSVNVEYNDFYLSPASTAFGQGNIFQNPSFVGGIPFSYQLQLGSPCIEAGDPSMPVPPFGGTRVDMGAFEFQQELDLFIPRGNIKIRRPQFVWSQFQDSDGVVPSSYRTVFAPNCNFNLADSSPVLRDTAWKVPYQLTVNQNYCWKVLVVPDTDDTTIISGSLLFKVVNPPLTPILPVYNSTLKVRRPTFVWNSISDTSIPEFFTYQVVLSNNSAFNPAETTLALGDTVWKADRNLVVGQTYYWKIIAAGDSGDVIISAPAKFTITGTITLYVPTNYSYLKVRRPTFIWQGATDTSISGSFFYHLILSKDSSFNVIEISPPLADTVWKVDHTLDANQIYFWKTIAVSDGGDTAFSDSKKFTIASIPFYLYLPSATIRVKQPAFAWQKVQDTSITGSYTYRTIVSKTTDFSVAETSAILTDTVWKVPHKLDLYSTYYWKVESILEGVGSSFNNAATFAVLPPLILPLLPLEATNVRERQPMLVWSTVKDSSIPDTFLYRVLISKEDLSNQIISPVQSDTSWQVTSPLQAGTIYIWKPLAFYSNDDDTVMPDRSSFFRELPSRIVIPDDRPKIQDGIDLVLNGDTVSVKPGVYYENISFKGKRAKVISEAGPESTTIAKYVDGLQLVNFSNSEDATTVLSGFTITGATQVSNGAAIKILNASPRIENNHIVGNSGDYGAIWVQNGFPIIRRNLIAHNTGAAAINISGLSGGEVINCTISDNFGDGIRVISGISIQVTNCIISFNTGYGMRSVNGSNTSSTITYDNVFGSGLGHFFAILPSSGMINADPLFIGGSPSSYHLSSVSPCIDVGDPSFPVPSGGGSRIDMGVFEFILTRGDLNGDGAFGPVDVVLEMNCVFLGAGNCNLAMADLDCDGQITPTDVVLELNAVFLSAPLPC